MNPDSRIVTHDGKLEPSNALGILRPYDIVVDGTDNMPARYIMSDACVILGKRNVYASIFGFEGEITVFGSRGPCYRCLYPHPLAKSGPPSGYRPVIGFLPGILGAMEAGETIDLILRDFT